MIVLVPSTIALLPGYAGQADPFAELRAACLAAVADLVAGSGDVALVSARARPDNVARGMPDSAGERIGRHLLAEAGFEGRVLEAPESDAGVLVVANGTARRGEKAPGHLDERAFGFDEALRWAVRTGEVSALRSVDEALAEELWCFDVPAWRMLGDLVDGRPGLVTYDDDPYGVQYWVATWG